VEVPYFLSKYDADALRFYLTATAPETRDTEFSWEDFVERNNNELVATWGNLSQRPRRALGFMLSFAYKRFDGVVPEPGPLDDEDRALLEKVEAGFETVGELYNACKFRAALGEALALAREANGYLDRKAPWFPEQGGSPGRRDERVCHPAGRRQPEDDPGADPAPHACASAQGTAAPRVPGV
jgi:methionyl-tRNA synthetase